MIDWAESLVLNPPWWFYAATVAAGAVEVWYYLKVASTSAGPAPFPQIDLPAVVAEPEEVSDDDA